MKKIALLKELGRAAYNNIVPNKIWESFNRTEYISIVEKATEQYRINVSVVKKCPVCGLNTLIVYFDSDGEYDEDANDGTYKTKWKFIYQVKCSHCGFELFDEIGNVRDFGFNQIEDYFWSRYL